MKIKNTSPGPRGLHTTTGTYLLEPGQTIEADMSPAEHASSYRTNWFDMPAPSPTEDISSSADDREHLKRQAFDLGIEYPSNIPTAKLKELIDAKLAA